MNILKPEIEKSQYPVSSSVLECDTTPLPGITNRAERTPGAVAVSGIYGRELAGDNPLPASPKQTHGRCGGRVILSECESGQHIFARKVVCGKEWCSDCGQDDSKAHNRRIARLAPKIQQIGQLGYFVIEFPDKYRKLVGWCYSKAALRAATNKVVAVLAGKRMGRCGRVGGYFNRGLLRWHWFGEKVVGKWNPHINVLVDSAFIEAGQLELIKAELRAAVKCPDLIIHYSFFDEPGQIYHKLKYVVRATFRQYDWNPAMAEELFNFRNIRWWGSWKGEPAWNINQVDADAPSLEAVNSLHSGLCPCCGGKLKVLRHDKNGKPVVWSKAIDSRWLPVWGAEEYGNTGYYQLKRRYWQGQDIFSPDDLLRLEQLELAANKKPSVNPVALLASHHAARKLREYENEAWWQHIMQENLN